MCADMLLFIMYPAGWAPAGRRARVWTWLAQRALRRTHTRGRGTRSMEHGAATLILDLAPGIAFQLRLRPPPTTSTTNHGLTAASHGHTLKPWAYAAAR